MPIPPFDGITNVIPPFQTNPSNPADLTPYVCTFEEVCQRFATTTERAEILRGCLCFREKLIGRGIGGFQWLDGSFVEDIETLEGRSPKEIDVVTFVDSPMDIAQLSGLLMTGDNLLDHSLVKSQYKVDHYLVPLGSDPKTIVEQTRYWAGLFSHRRDGLWKGMLSCQLDSTDHKRADIELKSKP